MLRDMGAVGTSVYVTRALYVLRGLVTARFLGPSDYGVWGTLSILLNYSNLAPMGSAEAVGREVPFYAQRGEVEHVRRVKEQSFSFNLYTSLLASLGILAFVYFRRGQLSPMYQLGLCVVAAGITLQQLYFFYRIVLRAEKRFFLQSKIEILFACVNVPLTMLLAALYGLRGLYCAWLVGYATVVTLLLVLVPIHLRWRLDRSLIADFIRIGFPVYLIGLVYTVFMSVDRIVIAKFLTSTDMGYYTIALTLGGTLGEIPMVVAQVIGPTLIERYSREGSSAGVLPYVRTPTFAIAFGYPVLQGMALFALEYVIRYFLPKYLPGLVPIEILIGGGCFLALSRGPSSFLLAVRRQTMAVVIYGICVGVAFGLNIWFVSIGMGLPGVALATILAYAALDFLYVSYVFSFFYRRDWIAYVKLHGQLLFPFVYALVVYVLLRIGLPLRGDAPLADLGRVALRGTIYLILAAPLLVHFARRFGFWEDLVGLLRRVAIRSKVRR
jgi:O-antigen/teichoic acid export membrane protein